MSNGGSTQATAKRARRCARRRRLHRRRRRVDSDWKTTAGRSEGDWRDEVIYQLLVDRFDDGDLNNDVSVVPGALGHYQGGDWQGVIDHLDYLKTLGVTALWISPVVRNVETDADFDAYHGYWQQDFTHVNPHFGDLAKLRELVQKAHAQGFKVILDIVTNHVAQLFYYDINGNGTPTRTSTARAAASRRRPITQPCPGGAIITHLTEYDPDFDPQGVRGYTSLGFSGLAPVRWIYMPDIDRAPTLPGAGAGQDPSRQFGFQRDDWYHRKGRITDYSRARPGADRRLPGRPEGSGDRESDDVRAALTAVFARWIEAADFDGFRIDTLKHVEHEFWQYFAPQLRQYAAGKITLPDPTDPNDPGKTVPPLTVPKPKFFMFGESFDGDDVLNGSYTMNQEVDSTFYFSQKFNVFDGVFKNGGPTQAIADQFDAQSRWTTRRRRTTTASAWRRATRSSTSSTTTTCTRFLFDKPSPAGAAERARLPLHRGRHPLHLLRHRAGVQRRQRSDQPRAAVGHRLPHRRRHVPVDPEADQDPQGLLRRCGAATMTIEWSTTHVGDARRTRAWSRSSAPTDGKKVLVVVNTSDSQQSETSQAQMGGSRRC